VASNPGRAALDVYLLDLAATLRESERSAECIDRQLSLVQRPPRQKSTTAAPEDFAGVLAVSVALVSESHRLVENVRAGRDLLLQLQDEVAKLRHTK
jgi:hypothetical protein